MMLLVPVLAAVVAVAGCGGGDGGAAASSPPPLPKAQFVKQANAICGRSGKEFTEGLTAFGEEHGDETATRSQSELLGEAAKVVMAPLFESRIERIEALGVPPGDQAQVDAYLAALEQGVSAVKKLSPPTFRKLEEPFQPAAQLAREYGLEECD